ncbi:MAG: tetratricopeptide repeat protein [Cyanobacteria bacterium P01_D01_bin.156]
MNLRFLAGFLATIGVLATAAPSRAQMPLLQLEGALELGDAQFEDGTFYDEYQFEVEAGDAVVITLESEAFDTYLLLSDEAGEFIATNDDFADATNSAIGIVLSEAGTYLVGANAYEANIQGNYSLRVEKTSADDPRVLWSEADRFKVRGVATAGQNNYLDALTLFQQALTRYQDISDVYSTSKTLRRAIATTVQSISSMHRLLGNYPESLSYYTQALALLEEIESDYGSSEALRTSLAINLNNIGVVNLALGNSVEALDYYSQSLMISQELADRPTEAATLENMGDVSQLLGNYSEALDYYSQSLTIVQDLIDREVEAVVLNKIGNVNQDLGGYPEALNYYNQSLIIARENNISAIQATALNNIGEVSRALGNYSEALNFYNQSLAIARETGDREIESRNLNNIGVVKQLTGNYPEALDFYAQSLAITREIGDREAEATTLNNIGETHRSLSNYAEALEHYDKSLVILREIDARASEAVTLQNIGLVKQLMRNYPEALDFYDQSLAISQEVGDRATETVTLQNIGTVNYLTGNYSEALDYHIESLLIAQEIGDRATEAKNFQSIGTINQALANYPKALEYYDQSLTLIRELGDRPSEAVILINFGAVHQLLGNYAVALDYYGQSLVLTRELGDRASEAIVNNNLGLVNQLLENYIEALDNYAQGLMIAQEIGDRATEATIFNNVGEIGRLQGNDAEALVYFNQSLLLAREIGDRATELRPLNNIGLVEQSLGNYKKALEYYTQSLVIAREIRDRETEAINLANIGLLFHKQSQSDLAIIFLKEAINTYEKIRTNNQALSSDAQQTYTDTVASRYRDLASLLLAEGRIPEAQQVLDLLQLEELREFTDTRAVWTSEGIRLSNPEQTVADAHGSLIALGSRVVDCERSNCTALDTLYDQQEALLAQYDAEVARFAEAVRDSRRADDIFQNPDNISGDAQKLLEAYAAEEQNTLLVYPFVLEDKLWLVWVTVGDVVGSIEVPVSQVELATTVQQFGALLKSRSSDLSELQNTSQKLYSWIIEPIAAELEKNNIDHLVFVNDRVTRYIPMGALHDGENYLLENYTISTVLSPAATDMGDRLGPVLSSNVLGLGLTEAVENFNPLPAVRDELAGIIKSQDGGIYPGQSFLNQDFTFDAFKDNVQGNRILHVATHAAFEPGRPEESFIVLGDGSRMRIPDIETMQRRLRNLHLVVLSACQTALGGTNQQDGTEITGLSSYFLEANRAEAVIASLWSVNDRSTSVLMQRFYENLAAGEPKADALRKAQLSLLGSDQAGGGDERIIGQRQADEPGAAILSHPYFWAPFILIGNGL